MSNFIYLEKIYEKNYDINSDNIAHVLRDQHKEISKFYSSGNRFVNDLGFSRFRDYTKTLNIADQYSIGLQKMEEFIR